MRKNVHSPATGLAAGPEPGANTRLLPAGLSQHQCAKNGPAGGAECQGALLRL